MSVYDVVAFSGIRFLIFLVATNAIYTAVSHGDDKQRSIGTLRYQGYNNSQVV